MFKLARARSFWVQPWFLVVAIVAGEWYGGFWFSLGAAEPVYRPSSMVVASVSDGFNVTIIAPGRPGTVYLESTN